MIIFRNGLIALVALFILLILTGSSEAAHPSQVGSFTPIVPTRMYDSRSDDSKKVLSEGRVRKVGVLGHAGVPSEGVSAVLLNVTVVPNGKKGNLAVFASDSSRPAGNLYFRKNTPVSNQILVPVGSDGNVKFYPTAATHVVVDVQGWVGNDEGISADKIVSFDQKRIFNTKNKVGGFAKPLKKNTKRSFKVTGTSLVPEGAAAVIVNVATIKPGSDGHVTLEGSGKTSLPIVRAAKNQNRSNQAIVPLGSDGRINLTTTSSSVDVLIDIQGYLPAGSSTNNAIRIANTLQSRPNKTLKKDENFKIKVAGTKGIPTDVESVTADISVIAGNKGGGMNVQPKGGLIAVYSESADWVIPANSMIFEANDVTSHTITVPVGPDGSIVLSSSVGGSHVIVDVIDWTSAPSLTVSKPNPSNLGKPVSQQADSVLSTEVLNQANKYAMTTWWNGDGAALLKDPLTDKTSRQKYDPARRLAMQSLGMATSLATGAYDPAISGVSTAVATERTVKMIDYVTAKHVSNKTNGWGGGWAGSMFAGYAGRAGWLIWDKLPTATQQNIAKMIYYEANDAVGKDINYMRDRSGKYLNAVGDTGAEDTAWWALPLQLASVMFPDNPRQPVWKNTYARYAIAAWAREADLTNLRMVNGRPVSEWINGTNVEENGIVYNHKRVAPDYMATMYQTMDDIWLNSMVNKPTPRASIALTGKVYDAYAGVEFNGKTIYTPNSGDIHYPEGIDWGPGQQLPYALVDVLAESSGISVDNDLAGDYKMLHLQAARDMQKRFSDGRTYSGDEELKYAGREEMLSQLIAQFHLTTHVRDKNLISFSDEDLTLQ